MIDIITKLEEEISDLINSDNGRTTYFEYCVNENQVNVYTYNNKNKEFFLLNKSTGSSYQESLKKALIYIKERDKFHECYTVSWSRKGRIGENISYFYCNDVIDVINKFFDRKDSKLYNIYEIKIKTKS
jgi:hypothetical protein